MVETSEPLAAPAPRAAAAPRVVAALVVVVLGCSALTGVVLADRVTPRTGPTAASDAAAAQAPRGSGLRPADGPSGADARARTQVETLLGARAVALLERDRDGWMAGTSPRAPGSGYAERQAAVFDDISEVPLAEWGWELLGEGPALTPQRSAELAVDGSSAQPWVAHVALVYRLRGAGGQVRREAYLTVAPTTPGASPGWALVDDTDGPTDTEMWDLGPVRVTSSARSLVLGTGDLSGITALVDAGAARVDATWGTDWPRSTVVEVPASQEQMARLLGRTGAEDLDEVAAVTTGEQVGGETATTGDRVVLNPRGLGELTDLGALVVMTHELTHVATRASTSAPVPVWLSEGYADWVGYRGQDLPAATVADPLLRALRSRPDAGDPLAALPDAQDFDPADGRVAAAYAGAWLAADLVARRYGEKALTGLYRDVASGTSTTPPEAFSSGGPDGAGPDGAGPDEAGAGEARTDDAAAAAAAATEEALRARLGVTTTAFTSSWRASVQALAAAEGRG